MKKQRKFLSIFLSLALLLTSFSSVLPTMTAKADGTETPVISFPANSGETLISTGTAQSFSNSKNKVPVYVVSIPENATALTANLNFSPPTDDSWSQPLDLMNNCDLSSSNEAGSNTVTTTLAKTNFGTLANGSYSYLLEDSDGKMPSKIGDFDLSSVGAYYFIAYYDSSNKALCYALAYYAGTEGTTDQAHNIHVSTTNATMNSAGATVSANFSDGDAITYGSYGTATSYKYIITNYSTVAQNRPLDKIVINGTDFSIPDQGSGASTLTVPGVSYGSVKLSYLSNGRLQLLLSGILCTQDIDVNYIFQDNGTPEYSVTVSSADTSQGTVTADFQRNTDGGGSVWLLKATPATGYVFDHWAYRTAGSTGAYTADNNGTASYTMTTSEGREYVAYFTPSTLSLGGGALSRNHNALYYPPSLSNSGLPDDVDLNAFPATSVYVGERAGFAVKYHLTGSLTNGTSYSFKIYAGTDTSGTPLVSNSGKFNNNSTNHQYIDAGDYITYLSIDSMPDVSQLTVVAQLGDETPVKKTYGVSPVTPTDSDYMNVSIAVSGVLEPTMVRVLKTDTAFDVLVAAMEKEYPDGNPYGTWYIDHARGFINAIDVDSTRQKSGLVHEQQSGGGNSDDWGWGTYTVNGYFCDVGTFSWVPTNGESIIWVNATPKGVSTSFSANNYTQSWALSVLREHYTDAELVTDGVTTNTTAAQLKTMFPQYASEMTWSFDSSITSVLNPVKAKIDAIGKVTKDSGSAIDAAKTSFNALPQTSFGSSGYYPYLFQNYAPYKTAYNTLLADEASYASLCGGGGSSVNPSDSLAKVMSYIQSTITNPSPGYTGGEWAVLALARDGKIKSSDAWARTYLTNLNAALVSGGTIASTTDYERVTLALSALGIDASGYNGQNLTSAFSTYSGTMMINAKVYALLALDSKPYTSNTGDFINGIIADELSSGGWAYNGTTADPDMTAMAIQALAPYYRTNSSVKKAVDKGLSSLKSLQDAATGGFDGYSGTPSTCSDAQIVTALCALNINPASSDWTTENGRNPLTALTLFYNSATGSFGDTAMTADEMATEQAAYALVAYNRYVESLNSLYDMSDTAGTGTVTTTSDVISDISALPALNSLTLDNENAVNSVWLEYQGLKNQTYVTNASTLTADKTRIDSLRSMVDKLSSDIWNGFNPSKLTLADKATIKSLMARYNAVNSVDQQYVQYYDSVLDAWQQIRQMEKTTNTVSGSKSGSGYQASLDKSNLTGGTVAANLGNVSVSFPENVLESLENGKTLTISQQPLSDSLLQEVTSSLPTANSLVCSFNLNLTGADGTQIHALGGKITVTLKLTDDELAKITDANTAILYYYDPSTGKLIKMDAAFNLKNKTVTFTTDHLSTFVIAQGTSVSEVSVPNPQTGDSSSGLPVEAAVLSIGAFAVLICLKHRNRTANRQ